MATFYDNWLGMWDESERKRKAAKQVIHEAEVEWVETQQDHKIGLLGAPETGFAAWGTITMVAEIAPGEKTGKHKHGEEAIHIVEGDSGCTIVNGRRYNWGKNSTMVIPFGAEHQHFNTGDKPVKYFAAMAPHLEHYAGQAKFVQFENWGKITTIPNVPLSADGFEEDGKRRVCMTIDQADWPTEDELKISDKDIENLLRVEEKFGPLDGSKPINQGVQDGMERLLGIKMPATARRSVPGVSFMSIRKQTNGFKQKEIEISGFQREGPHSGTGTHAHQEAMIYCLTGHGYTLLEDDIKVPWKEGSLIHVQGPQTKHQHFNESDDVSITLRIACGARYFFEDVSWEEFPYLYYSIRPELERQVQLARERGRERSR